MSYMQVGSFGTLRHPQFRWGLHTTKPHTQLGPGAAGASLLGGHPGSRTAPVPEPPQGQTLSALSKRAVLELALGGPFLSTPEAPLPRAVRGSQAPIPGSPVEVAPWAAKQSWPIALDLADLPPGGTRMPVPAVASPPASEEAEGLPGGLRSRSLLQRKKAAAGEPRGGTGRVCGREVISGQRHYHYAAN